MGDDVDGMAAVATGSARPLGGPKSLMIETMTQLEMLAYGTPESDVRAHVAGVHTGNTGEPYTVPTGWARTLPVDQLNLKQQRMLMFCHDYEALSFHRRRKK